MRKNKLVLRKTTIRHLGSRADLERVVGGLTAGCGANTNTVVICVDTNAQTNCGPNCPPTGLGCTAGCPLITAGC